MKPLRAVVTGGATNIGLAIAESLLSRGGRVVVSRRHRPLPEAVAKKYGDRLTAIPADVGQVKECERLIAEAAEKLGGLDVLVNNAAITGVPAIRGLEEIDEAHVDEVLNVNLKGVLFCSKAAIPHLRRAGGGVIVNISSINAFRPQRGALVYAATKAAMTSITQSMAKDLAPDRIRVVAVAPGDIRIDGSEEVERATQAHGIVNEVKNQTPLGRGSPPDIGEVTAFLCSDACDFVTGCTWLVDGGLLA